MIEAENALANLLAISTLPDYGRFTSKFATFEVPPRFVDIVSFYNWEKKKLGKKKNMFLQKTVERAMTGKWSLGYWPLSLSVMIEAWLTTISVRDEKT